MGNTTTVSLLVAVGYHLPTMIALAIALAMLMGGPRSRPRSVAMAGLAILMLCTALDAVVTVLPVLFVGTGRMEMLRTLNSAVLGVHAMVALGRALAFVMLGWALVRALRAVPADRRA